MVFPLLKYDGVMLPFHKICHFWEINSINPGATPWYFSSIYNISELTVDAFIEGLWVYHIFGSVAIAVNVVSVVIYKMVYNTKL